MSKQNDTIKNIPRACADEQKAVEFLELQRWGEDLKDACCPHCGGTDVYQMKGRNGERNKRYLWKCRDCGQQYTVRIGTVFEDSRIPLRHWCFAFWRACSSKKGVSALEIHRQTGVSYKSALFMLHRIRFAMTDDHSSPAPMTGTVEVDETYVGGKRRKLHKNEWAVESKTPVVAILQRDGEVRARVMPKVNGKNVKQMIRDNVHKTAKINTDESSIYKGLAKEYKKGHETVVHCRHEYSRGDVTTNGVEGFFSLLKRGITGIYHNVSKEHLHRYVGEFEYRYNTRKLSDGERLTGAIKKAQGKRLMYREPIQK
jgi:transposase-like protein